VTVWKRWAVEIIIDTNVVVVDDTVLCVRESGRCENEIIMRFGETNKWFSSCRIKLEHISGAHDSGAEGK
jgi:hypothetical protein